MDDAALHPEDFDLDDASGGSDDDIVLKGTDDKHEAGGENIT
jgi:hypothetical protein